MPIDLDAYLDRIRFEGSLAVGEATLARLHEAHVGSIPFETYDLFLGRPIRLGLDALEAKLVRGGRGGYCFEHATLFKAVLDRLGFSSQILMARVGSSATRVTARNHMMLKVDADGTAFLADVGYGVTGLLRPIPLMPDLVHHVPGAAFRLRHEAATWVLDGDIGGDDFVPCYSFTLEPHYPIDIEMANHYSATHPASPFVRTPTAQLTRAEDRRLLRGRTLEHRRAGRLETSTVADDEMLLQVLDREFGLAFPPGTQFAPPPAAG